MRGRLVGAKFGVVTRAYMPLFLDVVGHIPPVVIVVEGEAAEVTAHAFAQRLQRLETSSTARSMDADASALRWSTVTTLPPDTRVLVPPSQLMPIPSQL